MKPIYLKKNEDRRIRAGHLWVFSNEVDTGRSPLRQFEPGEPTAIFSSGGSFLGNGYVNPNSLICARIVSTRKNRWFGPDLVLKRLERALELRKELFSSPCYRLVFGEGDLLPGLVVDRFDTILAVQVTTAGMERIHTDLQQMLIKLLAPQGIVWRNDVPSRRLEGLSGEVVCWGDIPETGTVTENGFTYEFPLLTGQKTGWFFDQRVNRARFAACCSGKRVLDVFSYVGGTAILAAHSGAAEVQCIDSSSEALEYVERNSRGYGFQKKIETTTGNAFDLLKDMAGERFGAVMLDPPAFIKRKKDYQRGKEAYVRLNSLGLDLVQDKGWFMTCSCSQHLDMAGLVDVVRRAGLRTKKRVRILEKGGQGPDHPVHPSMPETAYLKSLLCWIG
ncbi:MAG: class I SAM-dependent rRNA methyltransferase [Desulfovibrionales bacterium]